jgi:hypothetical protein
MIRRVICLLCLLIPAVAVQAQGTLWEFDPTALGYVAHTLQLVDADGDPRTRELLAVPQTLGGQFRVVAISPDGQRTCPGAWFVPAADFTDGAWLTLERDQGRDIIVARSPWLFSAKQRQRGIPLVRPPCA